MEKKYLKLIIILISLIFVVSSLNTQPISTYNIFTKNNINTNNTDKIVQLHNIAINPSINYIMSINNEISKLRTKTTNKFKNSLNKTIIKKKSKIETGCCSVLLQINSSTYVYAYRRDSAYTANLYLKKVKLHGIEALKEYKTRNTYFFHTIIFKNGWYLGAGGSDNPKVNEYLENLGAKMIYKNSINSTYMQKAMQKVKSSGLGHFVIKSPNGKVGVAVYNYDVSKLKIFKMKSGEYLSIPNSPNLFRHGEYIIKNSSVDAAIYIAGTDKFGVNRRNIMVYDVTNFKYDENNTKNNTKTLIKIWTSNDNGKYVGRASSKSDNIIFNGKIVRAESIPIIPNKKYIGELTLK